MGVKQQLSLEDPHSRLKWLPPSKPKVDHSPDATRTKQLPRNQHFPGLLPMPAILESPYSFTETANPYVKLKFHQILEPL